MPRRAGDGGETILLDALMVRVDVIHRQLQRLGQKHFNSWAVQLARLGLDDTDTRINGPRRMTAGNGGCQVAQRRPVSCSKHFLVPPERIAEALAPAALVPDLAIHPSPIAADEGGKGALDKRGGVFGFFRRAAVVGRVADEDGAVKDRPPPSTQGRAPCVERS
jgi:hypothetical protein